MKPEFVTARASAAATSAASTSVPAQLPLVIQPNGSDSLSALLSEISSQRNWLEKQLLEVGAILIRGYEIHTPEEFQQIVQKFIETAVDYTRGASPRSKVSGKIYTSTDAPRFIPIPLHCELSYTPTPPRRIMFFCHTPAAQGGETPIADMRSVYQALDADVRQRLEDRGVRLIQNVPAKKSFGFGKTWQEMFGTDDKVYVEKACERMEISCAWRSNDTLQLINDRPAFLTHPETGDRILFTSFYNFHDSWSDEFRIHQQSLLSWLIGFAEIFRAWTGKPAIDYPHHCTFADGSEIPRQDILHIRNTLRSHAVTFPWQQGDLIVIDNLRVSHGRMPYRGKRKILVAMGN
jgi:alpha-ketoglutarate-dependent taurine dioxygenase